MKRRHFIKAVGLASAAVVFAKDLFARGKTSLTSRSVLTTQLPKETGRKPSWIDSLDTNDNPSGYEIQRAIRLGQMPILTLYHGENMEHRIHIYATGAITGWDTLAGKHGVVNYIPSTVLGLEAKLHKANSQIDPMEIADDCRACDAVKPRRFVVIENAHTGELTTLCLTCAKRIHPFALLSSTC